MISAIESFKTMTRETAAIALYFIAARLTEVGDNGMTTYLRSRDGRMLKITAKIEACSAEEMKDSGFIPYSIPAHRMEGFQ